MLTEIFLLLRMTFDRPRWIFVIIMLRYVTPSFRNSSQRDLSSCQWFTGVPSAKTCSWFFFVRLPRRK